MINFALKQVRKDIAVIKTNASYLKMFNQALDNFELNKLEEKNYVFLSPVNTNDKAG